MSSGIFVASAERSTSMQRHERPQMADIARMAGVSIASVSRALNGERGVSPRTRARVESIARALHYEVDDSARKLRLGHNRAVAIVVCRGPGCDAPLSDNALMRLVGAVADALADSGFEMVLSRVQVGRRDSVARDFEAGRAIGLVLLGQPPSATTLDEMTARGIPFVVNGVGGTDAPAERGPALVRALVALLKGSAGRRLEA